MTQFKKLGITGLLAAALCQFALTPASEAKSHGGHGKEKDAILSKLNLTPEQKQKIQQIKQEGQKEGQGLRAEMKKSWEELKNKMSGTAASDDDLKSDFNKIQEKRTEMAKKRFDRMLQVRAVLTPEQRQKFRAEMEKRHAQHKGKGRGHHMHDDHDHDHDHDMDDEI